MTNLISANPLARWSHSTRCRLLSHWHRGILALGLACVSVTHAAELPFEYQLKAGFLFNFARFIEWPESILPPEAPLRVGIIATDEIFDGIHDALSGKMVGGHSILVERTPRDGTMSNPPHMVFVQKGESFELGPQLSDLPVLIIGETPGFAVNSGMIGFVFRGDRLRFQVNIAAASKARLQVSSQLANYAEIVRPR